MELLHGGVTKNKPRNVPPDINYAKQEHGTNLSDSKILGVAWDKEKEKDTFGVKLKITVK